MKLKRVRNIIFSAILLLSQLFIPIGPVFAVDQNLISNPSAESSTATGPDGWQSNDWGDNTASLTYANTGHTGNRSLAVSMTSRASGDAKWMHAPVAVAANSDYTYTNWYKSSTTTEVDLQYTLSDGNYSYSFVKIAPTSNDWTNLTANFTTPANAVAVVVMHIIAAPGELAIDDVSLTTVDSTTQPTDPETPTDPAEPTDPTDPVVVPTDPVDPTEPTDPVVPTDPAPVDNDNLIANNSFEAGTVAPSDWNKNAWGTNNSTFTYDQTGRTGSRSVTTRVSSISSGDAKWYATPVDVVTGKSYQYSDYMKSDVTTRVVAAFIDDSGSYTYKELDSAPAASTWTKYSTTFTIPSTTKKVSIYHVIDRIGYLTIDDTSLSVAVPASTTSLIQNPSLETSDGNQPANWVASEWGTNSPTYTYANDGHTGDHSVKVTMSNYQSGDAKWYFNPISLTQGQQYRFTTWFKGNVTAHPVAMFLMEDGSEQYFGMPIPSVTSSSTTWQQYSDTFSVPTGAAKVSVFMYINENGWLQTDDYSIDSYHPNGFSRALLSLTFDDGHEDNATTALPLLNQYGFKTTQCYASTYIEGQPQSVIDGVLAFKNAGHEICSHTVTHPFLSQLSTQDVDYELSHSKNYLEQITGQPITSFASPYGDYSPSVITEIKKYYTSHRSVDEGYNSQDNFDAYNLRVQNILDTTTAAEVASWIAHAQADNTWLILVFHRVANDPGPYDTYTQVFAEQLKAISDSGITVKTMGSALDEVSSQL